MAAHMLHVTGAAGMAMHHEAIWHQLKPRRQHIGATIRAPNAEIMGVKMGRAGGKAALCAMACPRLFKIERR